MKNVRSVVSKSNLDHGAIMTVLHRLDSSTSLRFQFYSIHMLEFCVIGLTIYLIKSSRPKGCLPHRLNGFVVGMLPECSIMFCFHNFILHFVAILKLNFYLKFWLYVLKAG